MNERENEVPAVRTDIDAAEIGGFGGGWAIVCLQERAVIVVINSEDAPLGVSTSDIRLVGKRHISDGCLYPSPTIDLKHAPHGYCAKSREGPRTFRVKVLKPIKTSHDIGKTEVSE